MVFEILDAQSVGEIVVTRADVHPPPDLDLEVKLEQQEGGDDDIEEVPSGICSFSPPPPLPIQKGAF